MINLKTQYWINTITHDHVQTGVEGGFTQADHGKSTRLNRLQRGDYMVFYSPRETFEGKTPLQAFTALGQITDEEAYQVTVTECFCPWRRNMAFLKSNLAPIRPLLPKLAFIPNKQRWGFPFRRGLFQIDAADFKCIASAMEVGIC